MAPPPKNHDSPSTDALGAPPARTARPSDPTPPRITVFVPVGRGAKELTRLYESLLAQSFHDFLLLIVDDGTDVLVKQLADAWIAAAPY
jgi:hypothetical protein